MYPHFLDFKNRERANENHKADLRQKLRKIKDRYTGYGDRGNKNEYKFPKMTEKEFGDFSNKLQKARIRENRIMVLIFIVIIILSVLIVKYEAEIIAYLFD
ncbi:MAG: hypothetical protein KDC69_03975 [Flavobacteriaceae bacterium]|nr:hypothetical protein [Flavobacteriaceae bacterium]